MTKEKEITIFICKSRKITDEIIDKYVGIGKITFADTKPAHKRKEVVKALEEIDKQ